ncbi:Uncharacterised protein [Mycobacteroides abscessus subsp. massiliense]|nr:Uncharacterised protein [Mycobacteroides abscessus subsp. massiliense]
MVEDHADRENETPQRQRIVLSIKYLLKLHKFPEAPMLCVYFCE